MNAKPLVTPLFLLAALQACGSPPPDPTSSEALTKAPSMQWGTTCVQHDDSSYGTASSHTKTPKCFNGRDCGDIASDEAAGYGGGASYYGDTYYTDFVYFEGTCDNQRPARNAASTTASMRLRRT
jgi:hypothetical protein